MKYLPIAAEDLRKWKAPEGSVNFYYGRIGSGKTYAATADLLDLLDQGQIVYANWMVDWHGYFTAGNRFQRLLYWCLGWRVFDGVPRSNFHYVPPDQMSAEFLNTLADCHVFIDEGQNLLDSYKGTEFSIAKRRLIQYTRHYHRTLNIIAQRTQSVQVTARAQVNRFYKCTRKGFRLWPRFVRQEFADISGEDVAETPESLVSEKHYWGRNRVFNAYDSKYMRQGVPEVLPKRYRVQFYWSDLLQFLRASAEELELSPDTDAKGSLRSMLPFSRYDQQGKKSDLESLNSESLVPPLGDAHADGPVLRPSSKRGGVWISLKALLNTKLW